MIQYTMDHYEWLEKKGFRADDGMPAEKKAAAVSLARARLQRWPRLEAEDLSLVRFGGPGPQRFCPEADEDAAQVLGDPGEDVFVVSLARRPEKRERVLAQLEAHGLNAGIVNACDGDGLLCQGDLPSLGLRIFPGYTGYSNHDMPFTTGEVGCFMSHFTIWQHMVEKRIPSALILEDDFDLQADFAARLGACLREARHDDWNLLYVGRSPMENDVRKVSEHVVQPGYTLWTVGYVLRLEGAEALLSTRPERVMLPLDDFFSIAMGCGTDGQYNERAYEWCMAVPRVLRALALHPPLVMPYVGSMFLSDTAMLRSGTRFVKDLPLELPHTPGPGPGLAARGASEATREDAEEAERVGDAGMPESWREALHILDRFRQQLGA